MIFFKLLLLKDVTVKGTCLFNSKILICNIKYQNKSFKANVYKCPDVIFIFYQYSVLRSSTVSVLLSAVVFLNVSAK